MCLDLFFCFPERNKILRTYLVPHESSQPPQKTKHYSCILALWELKKKKNNQHEPAAAQPAPPELNAHSFSLLLCFRRFRKPTYIQQGLDSHSLTRVILPPCPCRNSANQAAGQRPGMASARRRLSAEMLTHPFPFCVGPTKGCASDVDPFSTARH